MINGRGKKKKQSSDTQICFQFLDFFSNLWFLLKYWIIWTFIEMKACEKFRGKNHYLVELLTTHRHLKCDPDYTVGRCSEYVSLHVFTASAHRSVLIWNCNLKRLYLFMINIWWNSGVMNIFHSFQFTVELLKSTCLSIFHPSVKCSGV